MNKIPLTLAVLILFSGCTMGPRRRNPFTNLNLNIPFKLPPYQEPALEAASKREGYKNLTLAVIESINSRGARAMGLKYDRWSGTDTEKNFENVYAILGRNFKAVVKIERMEEAKAANADLIAVLDTTGKMRMPVFRKITVEFAAFFLTTEGQLMDVARGVTVIKNFPINEFGGGEASQGVSARATAESLKKLELAILSSEKLSDLDGAKSGSPRAPRLASDVDRPGYRLKENPEDFALVIGIGKYSGLSEAEFAERDAETVREHLLALGYPARNIVSLAGEQAGRASLEKYVESWLPMNVKEASRVFVYFSGHGAKDAQGGTAYLMPWDGDPKFLANTGYPLRRLHEQLDALKAKEVLLVLEACLSGAQGPEPAAGKLVVLAACSGQEAPGTARDQGHRLFTYHLLKGLGGDAKDKSGRVTVKGLYDYLLASVGGAARQENRAQTPQLWPQDLGERAGLLLR